MSFLTCQVPWEGREREGWGRREREVKREKGQHRKDMGCTPFWCTSSVGWQSASSRRRQLEPSQGRGHQGLVGRWLPHPLPAPGGTAVAPVVFASPRSPDQWAPVGRQQRCEGAADPQARWREAGERTLPCQPQVRTPGEEGRKRNETQWGISSKNTAHLCSPTKFRAGESYRIDVSDKWSTIVTLCAEAILSKTLFCQPLCPLWLLWLLLSITNYLNNPCNPWESLTWCSTISGAGANSFGDNQSSLMKHCAVEHCRPILTQHSHPVLTVPRKVLPTPGSALLPQACPLPPRDTLALSHTICWAGPIRPTLANECQSHTEQSLIQTGNRNANKKWN